MIEWLTSYKALIPLSALVGAGALKLWTIFRKAATLDIDKFKVTSNAEIQLRDDLMERLDKTEQRMDRIIKRTDALSKRLSAKMQENIVLKQSVKDLEYKIGILTSLIEEIIDSLNLDNKINVKKITSVLNNSIK